MKKIPFSLALLVLAFGIAMAQDVETESRFNDLGKSFADANLLSGLR